MSGNLRFHTTSRNLLDRIYRETLNALRRKLGADRDVIDYIKEHVEIRLLPYSNFPERMKELERKGIEEYASRLAAYGLSLTPSQVERLGHNSEISGILDSLSPQQKKRIAEMLKRVELHENLKLEIAKRENRISRLTEEMKSIYRKMESERSRMERVERELEGLRERYQMLKEKVEERKGKCGKPALWGSGLEAREELRLLSRKMREKEWELEILKKLMADYRTTLRSTSAKLRELRRGRRELLSEMEKLRQDYELWKLIQEYARKLRIQKEFLYCSNDDWNAHPDFKNKALYASECCTQRRGVLIDTFAAELGHFIGFFTYLKHKQRGFDCDEESKKIHPAVHELFDTVARRALKRDDGAIEMRYVVYEFWKENNPTKDTALREIKQHLSRGGKKFRRGRRRLLKFIENLERKGYSTLQDVSNASPEERYEFLKRDRDAWVCIENLADEEMDDPHLRAAELYFSLKKRDRRFEKRLLKKLGEFPGHAFTAPEKFAECWENVRRKHKKEQKFY